MFHGDTIILVSVLLMGSVGVFFIFFSLNLLGRLDKKNAAIAALKTDKLLLEEAITTLQDKLGYAQAFIKETYVNSPERLPNWLPEELYK